MVEYAKERTRVHVNNFNHLYETIKHNAIDEGWLHSIEEPAQSVPRPRLSYLRLKRERGWVAEWRRKG